MPSRNYPKDIFEDLDVRYCNLEHRTKKIENRKRGGYPLYNLDRLPGDIGEGEGFFTDTSHFCIKHGNQVYCMPAPEVGIGPLIAAIQQETPVVGTFGSASVWKIVNYSDFGDGTWDENFVFGTPEYHSGAPVWGIDFTKLIYQEIRGRYSGASPITTRLCIINADGTGRTVIHDTGLTGTQYYSNYCMSPDGQKVAFLDPSSNLYCVFADGSGDCGGGNLTSYTYGNPQWSDDSTTIYVTQSTRDIVGINFETGASSTIYGLNDIDYFWLSNDKTRFASGWFPDSGDGLFTTINIDGTRQHGWHLSDAPWSNPEQPTEIFWAPDDSFLILTRQMQGVEVYEGNAIKVNPDDISDYTIFHWPSEAESRGVANWTLALDLSGNMKLYGEIFNSDIHLDGGSTVGPCIYQWDVESGAGEGWVVTYPNWDEPSGTILKVWDRYSICGLASNTSFFGAIVWDI